MAEIQQTRWDRIIRRVTGSVGTASHVSESLSELFPVLDIERVPSELLILGGTNIVHGGGTLNAAPGDFPFAQLENPAESNVIATITSVMISSNSIHIYRWGRSDTVLGVRIGTETFRDTRRPLTSRPNCKVRQGRQAGVVGGTCQSKSPANVPLELTDPNDVMVLGPGTVFEIGTETEDSTIFYCFNWRERPAEQSELQF